MRKEYLQLTIEELLENREFIAWLLRREKNQEWELFLSENPEFKSVVNKARKIVDLLHDRYDHLSDDELVRIWRNIENFDLQTSTHSHRRIMPVIQRYAAVLIIALLAGSAGYWILEQNKRAHFHATFAESATCKQGRLLLANGTSVDLEKQSSKIALSGNQKITIDNDKVIDLGDQTTEDELKMNEVVIPYGKKSQLVLEDGTKVWLNAGSRMAFPTRFTGKKREIFLEGEGYFEVAHSLNRPFIVNTEDISIKVLGTKFDLSAYKNDKRNETVLLEGSVAITQNSALGFLNRETILSPNQKASFDRRDRSITVMDESNADLAIAWTEGWFKFSRQSMNEVMNKLQRYYNVRFVFDHEFPAEDRITGKLDLKESVESVMVALSDVAGIQYRIDNQNIYIYKK